MSTVSCKGKITVIYRKISGTLYNTDNGYLAHPEVGAEDMWVAASYLKNTLHTLAKQLWGVHVLQDGLQVAHHQLEK